MILNSNFVYSDTFYLNNVLETVHLRNKFAEFIDTVLRQLSSDEFYNLTNKLKGSDKLSDELLYKKLLKKIGKILPSAPWYKKLDAIRYQKKILKKQAKQLLSDKRKINGCLEIGTPGSYLSSMSFLNISGPIYAMCDDFRFSDFLQAPSPNPFKKFKFYDHGISLNNYSFHAFDSIASNSLDLVICFIGFHHIPKENLDSFISCLYRVLRPGGTLIIREHDCIDEETKSLIYSAHIVYNLVMSQEPLKVELSEYRNFQTLNYWKTFLEKKGFSTDTVHLLQVGDPTLNTMFKCIKVRNSDNQLISALEKRPLIQTYLSTPEWFNVDAAQEFATFIEHTPFYQFPYIDMVRSYWKTFADSYKVAARERGHWKVLTSSYTLMNLFVGVTMSCEYGVKSLISAPIRWMYSQHEPTTIAVIVQDLKNELQTSNLQYQSCRVVGEHDYLIEIPRYKGFLRFIRQLANTSISIKEVAGQAQIQYKVRYKDPSATMRTIACLQGCHHEYAWTLPTQPEYTYAALTVQVSEMTTVLRSLQENNIELLYIHDF
jgi:SAM-dependent methyltransferase